MNHSANTTNHIQEIILWLENNGHASLAPAYASGLAHEWNSLEAKPSFILLDESLCSINEQIQALRLAGIWPFYTVGLATLMVEHLHPTLLEGANSKQKIADSMQWTLQPELISMMLELHHNPRLALQSDKLALMRKGYELGYGYERDYKGCAQCTLGALLDILEREEPTLFRAANGFAAGMALYNDGACGGYSGGLLTLGLFAGRRRENFDGDREEKDKCYAYTKQLHDKFVKTYGTVICDQVHKEIFGRSFCMRIEKDKPAFEEAGAHTQDKCPAVVGSSVAWVIEILYDNGHLGEVLD